MELAEQSRKPHHSLHKLFHFRNGASHAKESKAVEVGHLLLRSRLAVPNLCAQIYLHRPAVDVLPSHDGALSAGQQGAAAADEAQQSVNYHKVKVLEKIHRLLWESSELIKHCFGFGLVLMIAMNILTCIYRGYALCVAFDQGRLSKRQLAALLQNLYAIFIVHYYCEECSKSVIA